MDQKQRLLSMNSQSKCSICSNSRSCWRYEAFACNGCANFFYRSTIELKQRLDCTGEGRLQARDCFETNRCRACRLKLCIAAGMSEEAVRQNVDRRRISQELRIGTGKEKTADKKQIIVYNPPSPELVIDRVIANLEHVENAFNKMRVSKFNPIPGHIQSLDEALEGSSKLAIEYGKMEGWPLRFEEESTMGNGSFVDNVRNQMRLDLSRENYQSNKKSWYYSNVIFAIEYFKSFEVFRHLEANTRRVLAGKMALLCAQLANHYYSAKKGKSFPINPDETDPFEGVHSAFSREFQSSASVINTITKMALDDKEYVLLKALLILSPSLEDASTSERALLTTHSESYAKILLSYVMATRGKERGPVIYQEILALIGTFTDRVQMGKDRQLLYGAIGVYKTMCPLLEEILLI